MSVNLIIVRYKYIYVDIFFFARITWLILAP
jgi:hypothetical protein